MPVGASGSVPTPVTSTPSRRQRSRNWRPKASSPTRVTYALRAPIAQFDVSPPKPCRYSPVAPRLIKLDHRFAERDQIEARALGRPGGAHGFDFKAAKAAANCDATARTLAAGAPG